MFFKIEKEEKKFFYQNAKSYPIYSSLNAKSLIGDKFYMEISPKHLKCNMSTRNNEILIVYTQINCTNFKTFDTDGEHTHRFSHIFNHFIEYNHD